MAADEPVDLDVADPLFSWWRPCPSSTICTLLVGAALAVMLTIDQELGNPPMRRYGWPFIYQVEPYEGMEPVAASRGGASAGHFGSDRTGKFVELPIPR